jgi:hypothetical protein
MLCVCGEKPSSPAEPQDLQSIAAQEIFLVEVGLPGPLLPSGQGFRVLTGKQNPLAHVVLEGNRGVLNWDQVDWSPRGSFKANFPVEKLAQVERVAEPDADIEITIRLPSRSGAEE